jgi:hypothetical protein
VTIQEYNKQTAQYLSQRADDLPEYTSPMSATATPATPFKPRRSNPADTLGRRVVTEKSEGSADVAGKKKGKKWKLEEIERWTMVKRIW